MRISDWSSDVCSSDLIERAISDVYRAHGLSAGKRAGYSVGIGFPPTWMEAEIIALKRDDPTVLQPGMVFHIVPALREAGQFAVGCSETVQIGRASCRESVCQ